MDATFSWFMQNPRLAEAWKRKKGWEARPPGMRGARMIRGKRSQAEVSPEKRECSAPSMQQKFAGDGVKGASAMEALGMREELDAEAEVYILLVSGVGVEVVRGAAVELVTLAKFASEKEAESDRTEAGGDPADGFEDGGVLFRAIGFGIGIEDFLLWFGAEDAGCAAELHGWMIAQVEVEGHIPRWWEGPDVRVMRANPAAPFDLLDVLRGRR
jgi:hypothetical protein